MVRCLVLQVLATQACGIELAFSMCLLQCLHCTDEAHIGRNSAPCLQFESSNLTQVAFTLNLSGCLTVEHSTLEFPCSLAIVQSSSPVYRCYWALWHVKVSALVLQVLATQACGTHEFRMVLGGQPTPCFFFFTTEFTKSNFFTLPTVHDNKIVQSTSDGVEGKSG